MTSALCLSSLAAHTSLLVADVGRGARGHAERPAARHDDRLSSAGKWSLEALSERLAVLTPGVPVQGESGSGAPDAGPWWCIDVPEARGLAIVAVALLESGVPVVGAVHVSGLACTFAASAGGGATRAEGAGVAVPIHARRTDPGSLTIALGGGRHAPFVAAMRRRLYLAGVCVRSRHAGPSLALCLVAQGVADLAPLAWSPGGRLVAAHLILEAACGRLTDVERHRACDPADCMPRLVVGAGDPEFDWNRYTARRSAPTGHALAHAP